MSTEMLKIADKMRQAHEAIEEQIYLCNTDDELLAIGSVMMTTAFRIYNIVLGASGTRRMIDYHREFYSVGEEEGGGTSPQDQQS